MINIYLSDGFVKNKIYDKRDDVSLILCIFNFHFKQIIVRYKMIGYKTDVLRRTACLVVNPVKVNNFAYLFDCTKVGRAPY